MLARYSVKKAVLRIQLDFFGSGSVSGHKKSDPDPDGDTQILRSNDTFTEAVFLTIFYIEKNMFTGVCLWKKDPDLDPDLGNPKRPDSDPQHY